MDFNEHGARFMLSESSQAPGLALFATFDNSANSRYAAYILTPYIVRKLNWPLLRNALQCNINARSKNKKKDKAKEIAHRDCRRFEHDELSIFLLSFCDVLSSCVINVHGLH